MARRPRDLFLRQVAGLLLAALPAAAAGPEHQAPAENLAAPQTRSEDSARQSLLSEMWQRRILSNESRSWNAEDLDLLLKIRGAEDLGAITLLRRRAGGALGGLVSTFKPAGAKEPLLRLTKDGYDKWLFFRAQDAIDYFSQKGVDSGYAFYLEDLDGHKLFDVNGRLTPAGDSVYNRALANLPTWWKLPHTGEVWGTRPPSQAKAQKAPEAEESAEVLPITIGPEHAAIMQQTALKYGRAYTPQLRVTDFGRLRVVTEHEPSLRTDADSYVVVVARAKDKAAARREIDKRLPQLGGVPMSKILTLDEKLRRMKDNVDKVQEHSDGKVRWQLDSAAVEKQLRDLLKGKIAVAWVLSNQPPPAEPPPEPEPAPKAEAPKTEPKPDAPAADGAATQAQP